MRLRGDIASAATGPFVAEAAADGLRPPARLVDLDARAWPLFTRGGDTAYLDEYGDLWWGRSLPGGDARSVRPMWPEEFTALRATILRAVSELRARAAHPAGRARRH